MLGRIADKIELFKIETCGNKYIFQKAICPYFDKSLVSLKHVLVENVTLYHVSYMYDLNITIYISIWGKVKYKSITLYVLIK